jgi:predicted aconitase with swiveling domain
MTTLEFHCHPGIGEPAGGEALVASDNFSARYDLNRIEGVFSRPQHKLYGQSYVDRILVLNAAKGGVATAWMFHAMKSIGVIPKALLLNFANPILAQGAAFAGFPLMDRFDGDITALIRTGDRVEVFPKEGKVVVTR